MKKTIVVGIVLTSLVFAQGFMKNGNGQTNGTGMRFNSTKNIILTEAQQKDFLAIKEAHQNTLAPLFLNVQEKDLAIKKELLDEKPNWSKIEVLTKEKATIENQIEVLRLKNKSEMQDKFGTGFENSSGQGKRMNKGFGKGQCSRFNG